MRIEVWARNDMFRFAGTSVEDYSRQLCFIYDDEVSGSPKQAAERLWKVSNGVSSKLEGDDIQLRSDWDRQMKGFRFGVGDAIFAEGQVIECSREGFVKGETKDGKKQVGIRPR